jgi:hypothetical protein
MQEPGEQIVNCFTREVLQKFITLIERNILAVVPAIFKVLNDLKRQILAEVITTVESPHAHQEQYQLLLVLVIVVDFLELLNVIHEGRCHVADGDDTNQHDHNTKEHL